MDTLCTFFFFLLHMYTQNSIHMYTNIMYIQKSIHMYPNVLWSPCTLFYYILTHFLYALSTLSFTKSMFTHMYYLHHHLCADNFTFNKETIGSRSQPICITISKTSLPVFTVYNFKPSIKINQKHLYTTQLFTDLLNLKSIQTLNFLSTLVTKKI